MMVDNLYGRIVNLSLAPTLENGEQASYSAARAGIQWFTKSLASELGQYNITVNTVVSEFITTMFPEAIAHAVSFFASKNASFISGQVLYVANGSEA